MLSPVGLKLGRIPEHEHPCSWIVNCSNQLAKCHNVELHIIIESRYIAEDQEINFNNIHFHVLRNAIPFTFRGLPEYFPLDAASGFLRRKLKLIKEVKNINPDIVHAHGTEGPNALAAIGSGYKNIISIQGIIAEYQNFCPSLYFALTRFYEKSAIKKGSNFICKTDFDRRFVSVINPKARIYWAYSL